MAECSQLLHNMSAPPRSNIKVAGYKKPRLALSIHLNVPEGAENFACDILGLEAIEDCDDNANKQARDAIHMHLSTYLDDLPLLPVEPLLSKWSGPTLSLRPLYALVILSRSTRLFFMRRRTPELTPYRLNRRVYLSNTKLITALRVNRALRTKLLPETSQTALLNWSKENLQ